MMPGFRPGGDVAPPEPKIWDEIKPGETTPDAPKGTIPFQKAADILDQILEDVKPPRRPMDEVPNPKWEPQETAWSYQDAASYLDRQLDPDAPDEGNDVPAKKGGSYGEVFQEGEGDTYEVHHMPADSTSPLDRNDGPAIKMERDDHRQTESCGSSKAAKEYRAQQKELIEQGKFREAIQMDIDDIHNQFGDKYDDAIAEMLEYVDKLEEEGKLSA